MFYLHDIATETQRDTLYMVDRISDLDFTYLDNIIEFVQAALLHYGSIFLTLYMAYQKIELYFKSNTVANP